MRLKPTPSSFISGLLIMREQVYARFIDHACKGQNAYTEQETRKDREKCKALVEGMDGFLGI